MNATTQKETLDLGAMMEETLDGIPDAPDFVNCPPPGEYRLNVQDAKVDQYETKDEPGIQKQRLKFNYKIEQTVSVSGNEPPLPDNSMFSETFQATVDGLGYAKKRIKEIMNVSDLAGVTLGQMMETVKGQSFDARITVRKTAGKGANAGTTYENPTIRVIPPKAATA
jgi:hypothetical protein